MKLDDKERTALVKRELQLRLLIRQMELDRLTSSGVFQKLSNEHREVKHRLTSEPSK